MPGIWQTCWCEADQAWIVFSDGGYILARTESVQDAVAAMVRIDCEPSDYEAFIDWQRKAGRRCMEFARMKLRQQRLRERRE